MSDPLKLLSPVDLGGLRLANRVVMAPLTRSRANHANDAPQPMNAAYYAQRASAGLIISEATNITHEGKGYAYTPGIYTRAQIAGWRLVTDAVHAKDGKIFLQLWHVGRVSHPSLQPNGALPVSSSAVAPTDAQAFTEDGMKPIGVPRALETAEIPRIVDDYRRATENALDAGFDGVEIHGANAYLLDQFLRDGCNRRTDEYGGTVENRMRFPLAVVDAVVGIAGAARTGIRLSPAAEIGGLKDSDPPAVFFPFTRELSARKLAYVHVVEGMTQGPRDVGFDFHAMRALFDGPWMVNNGYTREMAIEAVASGYADLVAFGRAYLANPDLVERIREDVPFAESRKETWYGGGAEGYVDYPTATRSGVPAG